MRVWLKRYRWVGIAAIFLVLVITASWLKNTRPPQVSVTEATVGSLSLRIAASGLVEGQSADLGFKSSGQVIHLYVKEGNRVSSSQLLARLEGIGSPSGGVSGNAFSSLDQVIQAPYEGTVVEIYQREGSVVSPGTPVLRLVATRPRWVTAFLDSEDAAFLYPGQRLQCRGGGYLSRPWDLEVATIGREALSRSDLPGSARQVRVRCVPVEAGFPLVPGTEVDVDGEVPMVEKAVLVPTPAIVHEGSHDSLWVVEKGRVLRREIRLGPNNFDQIQIRAGLEPGETVVVQGKEGLTDGQKVKAKRMPSVLPRGGS